MIPSTFWLKKPHFSPLKNSKQELFRYQQTWYLMLKKMSSHRFFFFIYIYIKLKHPPSHLLNCASFVNTMERPSFYQLPVLKKIFLLPEIRNINFSFVLKFINSSFLLNRNFLFVQSSCFYNNFFLSFIETCFL